ncbi:AEC family transporter [Marinobacterium arenosum]|uniref:AEC family transporter n=1 Tax=Marinobacterium arenosum TaxID=2862496 RepID=UPI001C94AA9F|nr:AEC family transporter [Marinobacterium arenosum]MBY4675716.1 AEC family transporter [Marinobacterium arenosum]
MELYLQTLGFTANIVAPIFFIVFLGYLLKRLGVIDDGFVGTASRLVFVITLPALVFMSISRTDFQAVFNPQQLGYVLISVIVSYLLLWLLAARWIHRPEDLGVFIQGAFRSNYGIIGLAVSFNLFGNEGLAQASLLLALVIPLFNVLSIIALTVPMQRGGGANLAGTLLEILKNPLIIAVALALPFSYFGFQLPEVVQKTGRYFANLTLPLALLAIGGSLNMKSLRNTSAQASWASAAKLVILPLLLSLGAWLSGFRGQDLAMLFVLFGCPTAAASFVMAKGMGGNAELAANIILMTTLGSVLTLSAGIYLLRLWGVI